MIVNDQSRWSASWMNGSVHDRPRSRFANTTSLGRSCQLQPAGNFCYPRRRGVEPPCGLHMGSKGRLRRRCKALLHCDVCPDHASVMFLCAHVVLSRTACSR